ncbi:hypothetical protein [Noviherbaspirillum malthae]|uniref:hypothetical protein n=1 Tax=Noviherbaspirillum malthae TaxID=1260987 RepID=UPI0018903FE4|nr:hypothetical protein [Noviherbaspirillum malthae]
MRFANRHEHRRRTPARPRATLMCAALSAVFLLAGCGGYARNPSGSSSSGVEVYGTIDAGVQRERSR